MPTSLLLFSPASAYLSCVGRKYGLQLISEDQELNRGTFTCPIRPAEQAIVPAIKGLYKVADDWRLERDLGSLNTYISI